MKVRKLKRVEHRVLKPTNYKGLTSGGFAAILAIFVACVMSMSTAVTVDIVPDTLNVFNSTGNYVTAYVEQELYFADDFGDAAMSSAQWQTYSWGSTPGEW